MVPTMAATSVSAAVNQSEMKFQEGAKMYSHSGGFRGDKGGANAPSFGG